MADGVQAVAPRRLWHILDDKCRRALYWWVRREIALGRRFHAAVGREKPDSAQNAVAAAPHKLCRWRSNWLACLRCGWPSRTEPSIRPIVFRLLDARPGSSLARLARIAYVAGA